jgi:hypothetical protein
MKIDTTAIQFQMYKDIGWIPAKYFKESMSDKKWLFPQYIWIKEELWVLKNGASENAHYEREVK